MRKGRESKSHRGRDGAAAARQGNAPAPPTFAIPHALAASAALAIAGHLIFLFCAGGLWRDEANTVAFARMPSLVALWQNFHFDSVPLASTLLIRVWIGLGLGSDVALRVLGFLIGVAILAALFLCARITRATLPLCSMVLVALNAWVIRGGDAIRPTGLGMLFVVLTFGALAATLERPSPRRGALAALAAVMSVQSLYANVPLIFGIAVGGFAVAWSTRSRPRALICASLLAAPALSLLPYRAAIQSAREWSALVQIGGGVAQFLGAFREAAAPDALLWLVFLLAALVLLARAAARRGSRDAALRPPHDRTRESRDTALEPDFSREFSRYAMVTLLTSSLAIVAFFNWSRLELQPWYFLPWMALAGACADVAFGSTFRSARFRVPIVILMIAAAVSHLAMGWGALRQRQTNVDLIAARVSAEAKRGDLVIVSPWYLGMPFHRYYWGVAPWQTVPRLSDTQIHRIDLMKQAMESPEIIDQSVGAVDSVLSGGGTVWMVGGLPRVAPGVSYQRAPAAPAPGIGWSLRSYTAIWSNIVLQSVRDHAEALESVPLDSDRGVQPREQEALFKASGWR